MGYKFSEQGFNFTMPAGINKLVLKLILLGKFYECAEDFAVDDIQLRPLGPDAVIKFDNEPCRKISSYKYGALKPSDNIPAFTSGQLVNKFHNNPLL